MMPSKALESCRRCGREARRGHHMTPQLRRDFLQPRGVIDRGIDDCEIEATGCADVAVTHLTQMKCEAESDFRIARRATLEIACVDFFRCDVGCAQRRRASSRRLFMRAQLEN